VGGHLTSSRISDRSGVRRVIAATCHIIACHLPQKILVKKMNDQTVAAKDIGGGIVGTLVRFSWRCSACVSGLVALVAGALYWKVSCAQVMHKIQNFKIIYFAA